MTLRYTIKRIGNRYRATCEELGIKAVGPTLDRAVSALRYAIAKSRGENLEPA
jgi:hypothetical protein